jgi:hypothetical protein
MRQKPLSLARKARVWAGYEAALCENAIDREISRRLPRRLGAIELSEAGKRLGNGTAAAFER